jgi:hypothetical protein
MDCVQRIGIGGGSGAVEQGGFKEEDVIFGVERLWVVLSQLHG